MRSQFDFIPTKKMYVCTYTQRLCNKTDFRCILICFYFKKVSSLKKKKKNSRTNSLRHTGCGHSNLLSVICARLVVYTEPVCTYIFVNHINNFTERLVVNEMAPRSNKKVKKLFVFPSISNYWINFRTDMITLCIDNLLFFYVWADWMVGWYLHRLPARTEKKN